MATSDNVAPFLSAAADVERDMAERPIEVLRALVSSGELHHATYRCLGTVWEGLWCYRRSADGFRGYEPAVCITKDDPDLDEAHRLVPSVHVGCYGGG